MKVETLSITNFRSFGPEATTLALESDVTALVGNNGSGKTALFAALARLFGTSSSQRAFRRSDFHLAADAETLASETEIVIDCVLGFPELDGAAGEDDAIPEVFSHMSTEGEDKPLKVRMRLRAVWIDDGTPDGTIEEEFRWVTTLEDDYEWDDCRPVQAVERNFIQLIYVPASRNASDQVTNLLKGRLWRAARWSEALKQTAVEGAEEIQSEFDSEEPTEFISERLQKRWSQLHQADTDRVPSLQLVDATLEELVRHAEFVFTPNEAGMARRLEELSDGQKSLFHIALTAATLEIEQDALEEDPADSVFDQEKLRRTHLTILAIEEPENSLSPFFLSRIMTQAREIGEMTSAQVIVSSHSASILSRVEPDEVRYARLDPDSRTSTVKSLTLPEGDDDAEKFVRLAVKAYPELYFARFVILAEGDSEAIVLPRVASAMDFPLDRSFVPIVPLAGRFVRHFWRLLADLSIPYATLLDLDLGRKHGGATLLQYVVGELAEVGNDLSGNASVMEGDVDPDTLDEVEDEELLKEDQNHPWLKALRRENIFFSSPIDLDFAMVGIFDKAYQHARPGGQGPRKTEKAIADKKATTLKTGGKPDLYDDAWNGNFIWYPYLFLDGSKPAAHLSALTRIEDVKLKENAPTELRRLIERVKKTVSG